jgi:hypothetical protein
MPKRQQKRPCWIVHYLTLYCYDEVEGALGRCSLWVLQFSVRYFRSTDELAELVACLELVVPGSLKSSVWKMVQLEALFVEEGLVSLSHRFP